MRDVPTLVNKINNTIKTLAIDERVKKRERNRYRLFLENNLLKGFSIGTVL